MKQFLLILVAALATLSCCGGDILAKGRGGSSHGRSASRSSKGHQHRGQSAKATQHHSNNGKTLANSAKFGSKKTLTGKNLKLGNPQGSSKNKQALAMDRQSGQKSGQIRRDRHKNRHRHDHRRHGSLDLDGADAGDGDDETAEASETLGSCKVCHDSSSTDSDEGDESDEPGDVPLEYPEDN
jgi:hypothetical protein